MLLDLLLETVCRHGARPARAGEFSERAFLNGKMDLSQAEAVADLIASSSREAARGALRSLEGAFSEHVRSLSASLVQLRVHVEAAMDFPEEEGVDFLADKIIAEELENLQQDLRHILKETEKGAVLRESRAAVLAGPPNAGKSTLLNALSGRGAAIVSEEPGTTRDILREEILLGGMLVQLADTAGLRDSANPVEQEGMRRAAEALRQADHVLLVIDKDWKPSRLVQFLGSTAQGALAERRPEEITLLYSKCDLRQEKPAIAKEQLPASGEKKEITSITLSGQTGEGLDLLRTRLREVLRSPGESAGLFTARRRHLNALTQAESALVQARDALASGRGEISAEELRTCQRALGEIVGEVSNDELLGEIFSSFCIGK